MNGFLSKDCEQQLKQLDSFTKSTDTELENILSTLGWSLENLDDKNENYAQCPFNPAHRLPEKSLQSHIIACQWRAEGYDKFDLALSESTLPPDAPSTVKIVADLQAHILLTAKQKDPSMMMSGVVDRLIPRTSDRIFSDFTSDERKAIYDYVIANTQKVDIGHDITDLNKTKAKNEQKSISYLELIAQERNLKRRRAKHRGVHTNKKSHVEVMREVIEQQMEMFKEYLSEQNDPQDTNTQQTSHEVNSNFSCNSSKSDAYFEGRKYPSDRDANYCQRVETNERYCSREENRRERYTRHNDKKDSHHKSYKRDKHRTSEEKHNSRDRSRHRDGSRDRKRNRSKDRYRNRSNERKESRHDHRRDRNRSRSKTRR